MTTKKTSAVKSASEGLNGRAEYRFDYARAKPNRFAKAMRGKAMAVLLDADVASVFTTPESVNSALRALLKAMPKDHSPKRIT